MIRLRHLVPEPAPPTVEISGAAHHYLTRVLRLRAGDALEVFDGQGRSFAGLLEADDGTTARVRLGQEHRAQAVREVLVAQGLPKGDKLEWILEKATELGVSAVIPLHTRRAVVQLDAGRAAKKVERWRKLVSEAARQCRRSEVPAVAFPLELSALWDALPAGARVWVLDEEERRTRLREVLAEAPADAPIVLVVGPEGGFDRAEIAQAVSRGARTISLGSQILRTETAALAAVALIRFHDGVLG